jgi:hypothetical protein
MFMPQTYGNKPNTFQVSLSDKQLELMKLISQFETVLAEGGGRSGKTFLFLYVEFIRSLLRPSRHLAARFRFSHAKQSLCYDTIPKLIEILKLSSKVVRLNKSDWFYDFANGSSIWIGGLDDKERLEKILGNEYATIFLNEASQMSFEAYEIMITRLNAPIGMKAKMLIDYNPPSVTHWGYKMFHQGKLPDGSNIDRSRYGHIRMNPVDNPFIGKDYIERLSNLTEAKKRRFLYGEYTLDAGKLWKRSSIKYNSSLPPFTRVLVGVDPAGTVDGNEVGIIIVGEYEDFRWVLDDYSMNGSPAEWASEVAAAYHRWKADVVIAEKNYGGDMVHYTLTANHSNINVQLINSSRSKIVRAEPIAAEYEHGKWFHRIPFITLEDELCSYDPAKSQSPNRMDALVFCGNAILEDGASILDAIGSR